jgi:hypothetical protein
VRWHVPELAHPCRQTRRSPGGGCRGTSGPDPSQLWQHRPKHGAPAVREREPAGGVSLKQPLQQQGGRGLRRDPGEQPIGGAGDAEQ